MSSAGVRFSLGSVALRRQPTAELDKNPATRTAHALRFHSRYRFVVVLAYGGIHVLTASVVGTSAPPNMGSSGASGLFSLFLQVDEIQRI